MWVIRYDRVVWVEEYVIAVLANDVHCVQDIQGVVNSSLDVLEVHFLNIHSRKDIDLLPKSVYRAREFR